MFLIEYEENKFINAEMIEAIAIEDGVLYFFTSPSNEIMYKVAEDKKELFLNNLNALDDNSGLKK